jgi:hypothetical protein
MFTDILLILLPFPILLRVTLKWQRYDPSSTMLAVQMGLV